MLKKLQQYKNCKYCNKKSKRLAPAYIKRLKLKRGDNSYACRICWNKFENMKGEHLEAYLGIIPKKVYDMSGVSKKFSKEHCDKLKQYRQEKHWRWKGVKIIKKEHIIVKNKDSQWKFSRIPRSYIIIKKYFGRFPKNGEVVHHIDNNPKNDRIFNLLLLKNNTAHRRAHGKKGVVKGDVIFDGSKIKGGKNGA